MITCSDEIAVSSLYPHILCTVKFEGTYIVNFALEGNFQGFSLGIPKQKMIVISD